MNALVIQIQNSLEQGRPITTKTGPLAAQVLKEIQKLTRTLEQENSTESSDFSKSKIS